MKYLSCLVFLAYIILMSGCNEYKNEKDSISLTDSTGLYRLAENDVKLVKTASVNFKVKNVDSSVKTVSLLAREMGGMIFHLETDAAEIGRNELQISADSLLVYTLISPGAHITARIPSENLEEFLYAVSEIGYYTSHNKLDIDDKSLIYLSNTLKNTNRKEVLSQPLSKIKKASITQTIEVKDEIIENEMQKMSIDADMNYSSVQLSLFQNALIKKEVIANSDLSDYRLPFSERLGNALASGWHFFLNLMIAIAHLWVLIPLSLLIFILYKAVSKRRIPFS